MLTLPIASGLPPPLTSRAVLVARGDQAAGERRRVPAVGAAAARALAELVADPAAEADARGHAGVAAELDQRVTVAADRQRVRADRSRGAVELDEDVRAAGGAAHREADVHPDVGADPLEARRRGRDVELVRGGLAERERPARGVLLVAAVAERGARVGRVVRQRLVAGRRPVSVVGAGQPAVGGQVAVAALEAAPAEHGGAAACGLRARCENDARGEDRGARGHEGHGDANRRRSAPSKGEGRSASVHTSGGSPPPR